MRPLLAATVPCSTMPSPGPARVASRALCQTLSACMAAFAGCLGMSHKSGRDTLQMAKRTMVTLWFQSALLPDGWTDSVRVTCEGGLIAQVETGIAAAPSDERHAAAIPGLANVHSHAFQRGMAGLAEVRGPAHDSFWTWRDVMYRFVDRLKPEDVTAIAAQAYVEMLE